MKRKRSAWDTTVFFDHAVFGKRRYCMGYDAKTTSGKTTVYPRGTTRRERHRKQPRRNSSRATRNRQLKKGAVNIANHTITQSSASASPSPCQSGPGQTGGRPAAGQPYVANDGVRLAKAYEVELELMADVRAYFDVAFQVRNGPPSLFLISSRLMRLFGSGSLIPCR